MKEKKLFKFSLDDIELFEDDENIDFAVVKLWFLSDGTNSHKNPISTEVLKRDAETVLGKFIITRFDKWTKDASTHVPDQQIMGYIPPNETVVFEEKDGKLFATVKGVLSKLYATDVVLMFKDTVNERSVSCEFSALESEQEDENGELPIMAFEIRGVTILGLKYSPSCAGAEMKVIQFSEKCSPSPLKEFAENRKINMESKTYKINKTELKTTEWGSIDKTEIRDKVMGAKNKNTLVHSVYALVEDGWEESPSQHLKYPLMQLVGDTFYFNRYALSSALAYAKQENETEVIAKVEKLYKKFKIDSDKEDKKKMEEDKKEFAEEKEVEKDKKVETPKDKAEEKKETEEKEKTFEDKSEKEDEDKKEDSKKADEEKEFSEDANADVGAYQEFLARQTEGAVELAKEVWESKDKPDVIMSKFAEITKSFEDVSKERDELKKFK